MADIVGGVVNHVDMGKADDANDEQAEAHCKNGLQNDAQVVCGDWEMSGVGHEELQSLDSNGTWTFLRSLFLYLPSYVSTGEVKIHVARDGIAQNFGARRFVEGICVVAKEDLAISRVRAKPEQRPERMAMYHTVALVEIQPEHEGINVVAPSG
jgi:hypothetical protein